MSVVSKPVSITVNNSCRVSGLLQTPPCPRACYVLAHGAGAGMDHPFMVEVARELAMRDVATLRYQFPYMERGAKRPDTPQLAQATVRAATTAAVALLPKLPLIAPEGNRLAVGWAVRKWKANSAIALASRRLP